MKNAILLLPIFLLLAITGRTQVPNHDDPRVMFGKIAPVIKNGTAVFPVLSWQEVMDNQELGLTVPNYTVVSYELSIALANGKYYGPYMVQGAKFTAQVKEAIKSCGGDNGQFFIENVRIANPDHIQHTLVGAAIRYVHN